ncbi:MAG: glycerate kinase, partial [Calditrichaeota bacterium]
AAGLSLVPLQQRNPLNTTSYGVGQLIRAAMDADANSLLIGIGGSATTDCGTGMAQALGVKFYHQDYLIRQPMTGELMGAVSRIELDGLDPRLKDVDICVACDIDNPLLGARGAARVFSPQKGASPQDVERLELHMARIIDLIESVASPVRDMPGAGAAGGLGAGLKAFLNAELVSGINLIMDTLHFDDHLHQAELILTGEGKIDGQTAMGKTIAGILSRARKAGVPVIAIAGAVTQESNILYDLGLAAMFSICDRPLSIEQAIQNAGELIANTSERMIRLWMTAKGSINTH